MLAAFIDVCNVVIKALFIAQDAAEVLGGAMRGGEFIVDVKDELPRLGGVKEEVTVHEWVKWAMNCW